MNIRSVNNNALNLFNVVSRHLLTQWIARFFGLVFLFRSYQHFNSYAVLGCQSYFENPRFEWIILGYLQVLIGCLLIYKPVPRYVILAAVIFFIDCVAYPLSVHVGDPAFILILIGLAAVQLGGDDCIPLATLPCVMGIFFAGLWKIHGGRFLICDLTRYVIVRYPWMDGFDSWLTAHPLLTRGMSNLVIGIEVLAPLIWFLLFFPKFWLTRSVLTIFPISLLVGIGLVANLDEFPWVMVAPWLLMIGPCATTDGNSYRPLFYPLILVLYVLSFINFELNLHALYANENNISFMEDSALIPRNRIKQAILGTIGPFWSMYTGPIRQGQLFGGETERIIGIQNKIDSGVGCGLEISRWERFLWERLGDGLKNKKQHSAALRITSKYQELERSPCSLVVFPAPFPKEAMASYKGIPTLSNWTISNRIHIGGDGNWDYLEIDPVRDRLFVSHSNIVNVIDLKTGGIVHSIRSIGARGICLVPDLNSGFISNGGNDTITCFNLETCQETSKIKVGKGPDCLCYEPISKTLFCFNGGDATATVINTSKESDSWLVTLGGDPESAQADGNGNVMCALKDTSEIIRISALDRKITERWKLAPGGGPTGMTIDKQRHRIFVGCKNQLMIVMDCRTGKIIKTLPIGKGVDACAYDNNSGRAFASCADGTVTIVQQSNPDSYSVVGTIATRPYARTMALKVNPLTLYLPSASFGPIPLVTTDHPNTHPPIIPESFEILVLSQK